MRSCIQIETASLVFAYLSLLITALGILGFTGMLVHANVLMVNLVTGAEGKLSSDYVAFITSADMYVQIILGSLLSTLAVTFAFSIILSKGLISKKAHLVKAYFVYGVTINTLSIILHFPIIINESSFIIPFGVLSFWTLLGCLLYSLILLMIHKTYLKLANLDNNQFCHKKLEEEKCNA